MLGKAYYRYKLSENSHNVEIWTLFSLFLFPQNAIIVI